jgi:hypothetical protein
MVVGYFVCQVEKMTFCVYCLKKIDSLHEPCPYCSAPPVKKSKIDHTEQHTELIKQIENAAPEEKIEYLNKFEAERLFSRGLECFNKGKAYHATKNRSSARKEFQRALKYFEQLLQIDPVNPEVRELRSKCLQKMT